MVVDAPAAVTVGGYEGTLSISDRAVLDRGLHGAGRPGRSGSRSSADRDPGLARRSGSHPTRRCGSSWSTSVTERTLAIVVTFARTVDRCPFFDEQVAAAMPVIESFELHPPTP